MWVCFALKSVIQFTQDDNFKDFLQSSAFSSWENGTEKSVFRDMQSNNESRKPRKDRVREIKNNYAGS